MKTKISIWQKIKRSITTIILCIFIIYYFRYEIWLLFKNQLIRIPEFIFTKFAIGTIISMNILIIFRYKIMSIIEIQIDNFIYTNFSSYYDWVIFITSLIFLVSYLSIKLKNKYVFSNKLITITICILLFYIYYKSQFLSSILSLLEPKPYDIIPLSCLSVLVISFINKNKLQRISKRKQQDKKNNLLLGKALKETESDILNYSDIARQITEEVIKINNEESFAIGITKSWGSGKTTFLNYLKEKIKEKDEDSIIIEFSPWYSKSEIDIITLFFTNFSKKLSKYHSSINNQLIKYLKLLLSTEKNIVTKSIDNFLKLFQENKDISDLYKDINQVIKDINRKIYIVIDDIDRLYASEIIECLKIIRNTANFNNVIYFVAYDPIYVQNAINKEFGEDSSKYIDKIIQLTFELPEIEDYNIIEYLRNKLSNKENDLDLNEKDIIEILYPTYAKINKSEYIYNLDITKYFTNFRDCNKVLNLFTTYKNLLKDEVIPSDLFLVCILRCLYPEEALIIYNRFDEIFKNILDLEDEKRFYDLFSIEEFNIQRKLENLYKEKKDEKKIWEKNNLINFHFSKEEELEKLENKLKDTKPSYLIYKINNNQDFLDLVSSIFYPKNQNLRSACYNYKTYYNGVVASTKIKYKEFISLISSKEKLISEINQLSSSSKIPYEYYDINELRKSINYILHKEIIVPDFGKIDFISRGIQQKQKKNHKYKNSNNSFTNEKITDLTNKLGILKPTTNAEYEIVIYGLIAMRYFDHSNKLCETIDRYSKINSNLLNDLVSNKLNLPIINIYSAINNYYSYMILHKRKNDEEINEIFDNIQLNLFNKAQNIKEVLIILNNFIPSVLRKEKEMEYYNKKPSELAREKTRKYIENHPEEFLKELHYEKIEGFDFLKFDCLVDYIFKYDDSNYQEFENLLETTIKNNPQDKELQEIGKDWEKYKNNNYEYFTPSNKKYNLLNL